MLDNEEFIHYIKKYINIISTDGDINKATISKVINTQIALMMGDLAVKGEAKTFLGNISYDGKNLSLQFSNLIKEIMSGHIDPFEILKEILQNE